MRTDGGMQYQMAQSTVLQAADVLVGSRRADDADKVVGDSMGLRSRRGLCDRKDGNPLFSLDE